MPCAECDGYPGDRPIPPLPALNWEAVYAGPIAENDEPLVPVSLMPERILVRPQYHYMGLPHALPECYARRDVFRRLLAAAGRLPEGFRLVILDAWRPLALQASFFTIFVEELRQSHPTASQKELEELATTFVARPAADGRRPSPHLTGGAVDLTLVDASGMPVEMGTAFDETAPASFTRYYEEKLARGEVLSDAERRYARNRRVLFHVMDAAGFTNLASEWWHFDYGNQLWAYNSHLAGAVATYGVATLPQRW